MDQKNNLVVSISMRTYNHQDTIAQAIESVLMQKTNFNYEIIVGEDCSTDNTRKIVIDYQKRYPNKIRLFLPERNVGRRANFIQTIKLCRGKYVALLDGDDYWTSPHKLQKQVEFLDSHIAYSACFHNVTRLSEAEKEEYPFRKRKVKTVFKLKDLLNKNIIPTCSILFRNNLFDEFPVWFNDLGFSDWPLHILNAQHGDVGYIDEVMAVSRVRRAGAGRIPNDWIFKYWQDDIKFYETINRHLEYKYNYIIRMEIFKRRHINRRILEYMSLLFPFFSNTDCLYRHPRLLIGLLPVLWLAAVFLRRRNRHPQKRLAHKI